MKKNQDPPADAADPSADSSLRPGSEQANSPQAISLLSGGSGGQAGRNLRRQAEERLSDSEKQKSPRSEVGDQSPAKDTARLVHELQVHQIELEMQNEELRQARAAADALLAQYIDLYDFAPTGYLTLDREGTIRQVNLSGARQLGVERSGLVNRRFGLFVAESDRRGFSDFLEKIFASEGEKRGGDWPFNAGRNRKESCEVTLSQEGSQPLVVQIEGTRSADGRECRAVVLDISARKRTEEALRTSLGEKEVLVKEIHHRVKNNMQVISSMLNLQSAATSSEECRGILQEARTRIRAISLVHEKLFQSQNLVNIDIGEYIRSLADHLFRTYLVKPGQVRLELEFEKVLLDINSAVPCGLLLNELIANALKHAFPKGRPGVLKIGLRSGIETMVELRVEDDGVGFPEGLDFRKATTFGLQIVNALVGQLEATMELERTNGTVFTVKFRKLNYRPRL